MVIALYTQILLPGAGGAGRGTPGAILFRGLVFGLVNALTAAGIILVYRTLRVINFAQTAIGAAGAILTFNFVQYTAVPFPIAFVLGLGLSALVGVTLDLSLVRRFFNAPRLVLTVVTIVVAGFLSSDVVQPRGPPPVLPQGRDAVDRPRRWAPSRSATSCPSVVSTSRSAATASSSASPRSSPSRWPSCCSSGWRPSSASPAPVWRCGPWPRTPSGPPSSASASAASPPWCGPWPGCWPGPASPSPGRSPSRARRPGSPPACCCRHWPRPWSARMRSLPTTVFAAVAISVVTQATQFSLDKDKALVDFGLLVLIAAGLLIQQRKALRGGDEVATAWQASEEQRPIPKELLGVSVRPDHPPGPHRRSASCPSGSSPSSRRPGRRTSAASSPCTPSWPSRWSCSPAGPARSASASSPSWPWGRCWPGRSPPRWA